jgi:hypothetical protein
MGWMNKRRCLHKSQSINIKEYINALTSRVFNIPFFKGGSFRDAKDMHRHHY